MRIFGTLPTGSPSGRALSVAHRPLSPPAKVALRYYGTRHQGNRREKQKIAFEPAQMSSWAMAVSLTALAQLLSQ